MWRPESWEEVIREVWGKATQIGEQFPVGFEAGADAMLEALKELPTTVYGILLEGLVIDKNGEFKDIPCDANCYRKKGWLIFIPDEEVKNVET